jgi:SAM-dependent methyltransferase
MTNIEFDGFCPICESETRFFAEGAWLRDELTCLKCHSIPRERALALVLQRIFPDWRELKIHESSPANRGISSKLRNEGKDYFQSHYYPGRSEANVNDFYNINLEDQEFEDETFDVFVSLDVLEHVFDPATAMAEIYRTLKHQGVALLTFPIIKSQVEAVDFRANLVNGVINYVKTKQYHGNPIDESGSLVTVDYGYDIHQKIAEWAPFNVEIVRFNRRDVGILGEYTEVVICIK